MIDLPTAEDRRAFAALLVLKWMDAYGLTGHGRLTDSEHSGLVRILAEAVERIYGCSTCGR